MKYLIIFSLLVFSSYELYSQNKNETLALDSRIQQKIDSLVNLANKNLVAQPLAIKESAKTIANNALNLSQDIQYKKGQAKAYYTLGKYCLTVSNDQVLATEYFLKSLEIYTEDNDKDNISNCYMQLGVTNYVIAFYEEAVRNLLLSLEFKDNPTAKYLLAISYTKLIDYENAKKYFAHAIKYYQENKVDFRLNECYLYLGQLYLDMNEVDSSFHYLNKVMDYNSSIEDSLDLDRVNAFISGAYLAKNNLDKAIFYAELSYQQQTKKEGALKDEFALTQATKTLSEAFAQKKNYQKAYFYLEKYNTFKNKYTEGSNTQKVTNMLRMFDFEKRINQEKAQQEKENEIAKQKIEKQRLLKNSFIIGFILLLLVLILVYNQYNLKRRSNLSLKEKNQIISLEKERSEELLLNILPSEVAEELKTNGFIESKVIEQVTVLFTDFKGFTSLTEKLSPKDLVYDLHECFSAFDHISEKYGIEKIKTIGDSFMAVGGLPTVNETHAIDAVLAALEMAAFIKRGKEKKLAANRPFFEIRIGLHTGPVVAGIVGLKKFQYDIWGDTVNIASRMESHGEVGKVNISQKTYELVKNSTKLEFSSRGKISVKGDRNIEMWFVNKKTTNL